MSRRKATAILGAVFVVALALAACGGTETSIDESNDLPAKSLESAGIVEGLAPLPYGESSDSDVSDASLVPTDQSSDRKIIQNTSMDLQVEDVSGSYQKVASIALDAGGYVVDSSISAVEDQPRADVTIRVPSSQYESVLDALRGLALKVENETSKAEDVTEQYTDLQARLRSAQAVEARYLDLLNRAQTIDDVLKVQNYLTPARLEVEQLQGQINLLDKMSAMATIGVSLSTEPPPPVEPSDNNPDPLAAAARGWEGSLLFLRAVGAGVLAVSVFLWWWVPVLVVAGIGYLVYRKVGNR